MLSLAISTEVIFNLSKFKTELLIAPKWSGISKGSTTVLPRISRRCELLLVFYDSLTWLGLAGLARLSEHSGLRHVKYRPFWSGQSGSAGHDFITCHLVVEFERQVIFYRPTDGTIAKSFTQTPDTEYQSILISLASRLSSS
jgi:hypothetical protein